MKAKNPFQQSFKQKSVFITAGFPKIDSLPQQIQLLQKYGIDFIEVGIPFSDPMADGPIIQRSSEIALKNGMHIDLMFKQLDELKDINVPLVLMGYFNPILQYGLNRFMERCKQVHIQGLIIPDLSLEIVENNYREISESFQIPFIYLISPETSNDRIARIAQNSKNGFIYLVSQNAITGSTVDMASRSERYQEIRKLCDGVPLIMGFGIKTRADVENAFSHADGAIIGSAYIEALLKGSETEFLESLG